MTSFRVETLAIGDEILTGKIADSNSTFVGNFFFQRGVVVAQQLVIPDDFDRIQSAIQEASQRANFVVCFGGLGPTSDDKTAEAVARLIKCDLVSHAPSRERLEARYRERNRPITPQALKQALYPRAARPLQNPVGMAPGFLFRVGRCDFICLPGVPSEMKSIVETYLPEIIETPLKAIGASSKVTHRTWRCVGIWESDLQKVMDPVEARLPKWAWLGYRTRYPENHLTLYVQGTGPEAEKEFASSSVTITEILKDFVYTSENKEPEQLVLDRLASLQKTLVLAESCTGGLIAQRLSRISGASKTFWGSYVTYQLDAKEKMLAVKVADDNDAVSARCAKDMAERALHASGTDFALSVTGFMGPTGGNAENPIGTAYVHIAGNRPAAFRISLPVRDRTDLQTGVATLSLVYLAQSLS